MDKHALSIREGKRGIRTTDTETTGSDYGRRVHRWASLMVFFVEEWSDVVTATFGTIPCHHV